MNEIKDYFIAETSERKLMTKGISKYIAPFDYFDKSLIVLSGTSRKHFYGTFCNCYLSILVITSASLSLAFSLSTGVIKNCSKQHEIKRKNIIKLFC